MNRQKTKALLSAVVILMISLITPRARADIILTTLVSFAGAKGSHPFTGLVQGSDSCLCGPTFTGAQSLRGPQQFFLLNEDHNTSPYFS